MSGASLPLAESAAGASLAGQYRAILYRRFGFMALLAVATIATIVLNLTTGPAGLSVATVWHGIFDPSSLDRAQQVILWDVRLPFALMAVVVGACLGLAGAEMQTVLNNALASPSTLGVMHAATVGASLAIVFELGFLGLPENYLLPCAAFIGATISIFVIQGLSKTFGATVDTVILFGIATVFALEATISLIQFMSSTDSLQQIVFWTMGSVSRATWEKVGIVTAVLALCLPMSLAQVWQMTALRGGEEHARSFGVSVDRLRDFVLLRVSLLTAIAISFTGIISFVGLVAPHIARLAFGEDHRFYIPGSAIAGAFILSGASLIAKLIVPGVLIPDGIVTALIGIPLFLALIVSQRRRTR